MSANLTGKTGNKNAKIAAAAHPLVDEFAAGLICQIGQMVNARPDAIAVADERRALSYRALAQEAVATMDAILGILGRPASSPERWAPDMPVKPVGLLYRHRAGAVTAVLGVLASGHPLLVLDPDSPVNRLKQQMDRVGARVCITDAPNATVASQIAEHVIRPVAGAATEVNRPERLWANAPSPTLPALLAFTSGSTGVPKVVVSDSRQLLSDAWANGLGSGCYGTEDVIAQALPLAFYAGLLATLGPLVAGAEIRLPDVHEAGITRLGGWLEESGTTVLHASPAFVRALVDSRPLPGQLAKLRSLTIAGETAYGRDVEAVRQLLSPKCAVFNRYGSSETGLITDFRIDSTDPLPDGPIPAGKPIGRTLVEIVGLSESNGSSGKAVAAGQKGTVTITRRHMALGYLNDPEATAATFSDNPDGTRTCRTGDVAYLDDGTLHLLGRRDHSVKIGGFLVEPGEVDAALFALPQVREAVVVGSTDPRTGGVSLIAYVVPAFAQLSTAALGSALADKLPAYMIPEAFFLLDFLPRTERGKLDRAALPANRAASSRFSPVRPAGAASSTAR